LRILYVVHQFLPRHRAGTELYTYYLTREMARRGHLLSIFTTEIDPETPQHQGRWRDHEGLPVFEAVHNHHFPSFRQSYRNEEMEEHFERLIAETRPDLVHFQHLHLHSIGYIDRAARHGLPMVYTLHEYLLMCPRMGQLLLPELEPCPGPEPARCARCVTGQAAPGPDEVPLPPAPEEGPGWSAEALEGLDPQPHLGAVVRRRQEIARRLGKVDLFISPSRFLRERFVEEGLIAPDRILFSDNGFPVELFESRKRVSSGEGLRVGFVGTIAEFKGVHLLVEAMEGIDDPGVSCRIHGALDTFPDYKERLLAMEGIEGVELCGAFEHGEIGRILSGIDVLVVPSLWFENSPLTIHEAFLAGVPVIASDRGGMAELVDDGKSGLLFRRGDAADLREKILRLRREPGLLDSLRRFPRLKTIAEDAERMEERYELLLRGIRPEA
jgi:glycosyltransferase involved in cell wall biosynthesis